MVSPLGRVIISEDALIWAKIKRILKKKGPDKAIEALKKIRAEQVLEKALVTRV